MTEAMPDAAALRARLLGLRDDLRHRLAAADVLDAGLLHLLASVEVVLAALERADEIRSR